MGPHDVEAKRAIRIHMTAPEIARMIQDNAPDGWKISYVYETDKNVTYSAVPPGGPIAVVQGSDTEETLTGIIRWCSRTPTEIDAHIAQLKAKLDAMPEHWTDARAHMERRIAAES